MTATGILAELAIDVGTGKANGSRRMLTAGTPSARMAGAGTNGTGHYDARRTALDAAQWHRRTVRIPMGTHRTDWRYAAMTAVTLPVLGGSSAAHSFAYWGDRAEWLIALSQHRDSDAIERSNWRVIVPAMLAAYPEDAAVESMSHWAVGWTETLLVRPGTAAAAEGERWAAKLADYPLADEADYSALEWSEEWCVRCDRGTREDHPGDGFVCRKFRSREDASEIAYRWQDRRADPIIRYFGCDLCGAILTMARRSEVEAHRTTHMA